MTNLRNLRIDRLIAHEIIPPSSTSNQTTVRTSTIVHRTLNSTITDAIRRRITDVLGETTNKAIELQVTNREANHFFLNLPAILLGDDTAFTASSVLISNLLATVQGDDRRKLSGPLFFMSGLTSEDNKRYVCIIKAEYQEGLHESDSTDQGISLQLLRRIFLTPNQKFYKVVFIVEDQAGTSANDNLHETLKFYLFDQNMTKSTTSLIANYFYRDFLGLEYPESPALKTKTFYDETKRFIHSNNDLTQDQKVDINTHLYSHMIAANRATINPANFATNYFPAGAVRDAYRAVIRSNDLSGAFQKDIKFIEPKLKSRSFSFESGNHLRFNSLFFKERVTIESDDGVTTITIQDTLK